MAIRNQPRSAWIWPYAVPETIGATILKGARAIARWTGGGARWAIAGVIIGSVPALFLGILGWTVVAVLEACALAVFVVAAAAMDFLGRGLLVMATSFLTHSIISILFAMHAPDTAAEGFRPGEDYWQLSRSWIVTGVNPEYAPSHWLPAHLVLLLIVLATGYSSGGVIAFFAGFRQLDLMNFYVGRLATESQSATVALFVGWHPWSVLRGIGFMILLFEAVNLSLTRLSGVELSEPLRRRRRWAWGLFFLVLDGALKYVCMDIVRSVLADNLVEV